MAITTVLFDLDDTLHDDSAVYRNAASRVARDIAASCGIDAHALVDSYIAQADRFWRDLDTEHLSLRMTETRYALWTSALNGVGIDDPAVAQRASETYVRYRNDALVPFPGAIALLVNLRAAGMRLGIVTNGFAETHHEKIERLGLTKLVDAVFVADEVGMLKPDPGIFFHACERLGSRPAETVMVGDRFFRDVTGAHEAGLKTVYIAVHDEVRPRGAPVPDAVVRSVAELASVLEAMIERPGSLSERTETAAP